MWLFSDFYDSGNRLNAITIKLLYAFFKLICGLVVTELPQFEKHFAQHNLQEINTVFWNNKLLVSTIYTKV